MAKRTFVLCLMLSALGSPASAQRRDFFAGVRYPGPGKAPGVDLYKVDQTGGPNAEGYRRRVVNWWLLPVEKNGWQKSTLKNGIFHNISAVMRKCSNLVK